MKRLISMATAAGLLAGALALPALLRAEDKREVKADARGENDRKEGFADRMREKFEITADQEAKLKSARRTKRDASAAAMAEVSAATRKIQDQLEDKASEKELSATLDKIAAARKSMSAAEEAFEASMRSILTPTQRAKMLVAMKGHMRGRGMPKGGMHGGMGGDDDHDGGHREGPGREDD